MGSSSIRVTTAVFLLFLLSSCESYIQTTSGQAYLERYRMPGSGSDATETTSKMSLVTKDSIDGQVQKVAAVEPTLRFPARIGLARIDRGRLSGMAPEEAAAWMKAAETLGPEFGQFVPLNRLIAEMVTTPDSSDERKYYYGYGSSTDLYRTMKKIRLGAARQHLDAVLVYEVYGRSGQDGNLLSALNFTIIGAFALPGETLNATGFASALLVDVRNGYPYGTVRKIVSRDEVTPTAGSSDTRRVLENVAKRQAAIALVPEVETMFRKLRKSLAALDRAEQQSAQR